MFQTSTTSTVSLSSELEIRWQLYDKVYRVRQAEEKIRQVYSSDAMKTPVHLSIGEEAIAAGVCEALAPSDQIYGTYRSHAIYLAKGGSLEQFFCELYGRKNGVAQGKAGSMHLSNPEVGFMASSAVVSSIIPVAVGAAFACLYRKMNTAVAVFFGDGATEEGVFWESLNTARLYNLAIIFVCEDNGLAIHAPIMKRQSYAIAKIGSLFGIQAFESTSTDAYEIFQLAKNARQYAMENHQPVFLHLKYHRYLEHVGINEDYDFGYRHKTDYAPWYKKDPVTVLRQKLLDAGAAEHEIQRMETRIDASIEKAVEQAECDEHPDACQACQDVCL
jgi:TPP-dependent pyruvate/acetoin dehydrogenase alpha subunit